MVRAITLSSENGPFVYTHPKRLGQLNEASSDMPKEQPYLYVSSFSLDRQAKACILIGKELLAYA